jgi:hypothetical protein
MEKRYPLFSALLPNVTYNLGSQVAAEMYLENPRWWPLQICKKMSSVPTLEQ